MNGITLSINRNVRGWQWLIRWPGGRRECVPGVFQPGDGAPLDNQALRRWMLSAQGRTAAAEGLAEFGTRLSVAIPELERRLDWLDLAEWSFGAVAALLSAQAEAAADTQRNATVAQVLTAARARQDCAILRGLQAAIGDDQALPADAIDLGHVQAWAQRLAAGGYEYNHGAKAGTWNRQTIRSAMRRLVSAFRLAAASRLCEVGTAQRIEFAARVLNLDHVPSGEAVSAVDLGIVEATLPHVSHAVATLARLQMLTGCRPGEACAINVNEIDRSRGDVWIYRPTRHKLSKRGKTRTIVVGPRAVELLAPLWPAAEARPGGWLIVNRFGKPYGEKIYRREINRGAQRAATAGWNPNQIRHTVATATRNGHGVDGEEAFLGHTAAVAREWYLERDLAKAIEIARKIG